MGPNPILGVALAALGGFATASIFLPFRGIKRWSWEVYWIIQIFVAWLVVPWVASAVFVPHLWSILAQARQSDPASIYHGLLWGIVGGVGGMAFGLAVRYLGIALGYAISLGAYIFFGSLLSAIYTRDFGSVVLVGLLLSLVGIALSGAAAYSKDREITVEDKLEAGERDYAAGTGLAVSLVAGLTSVFLVLGLQAGSPLAALAGNELAGAGRSALWSNLPVLTLVLTGGFLTNLVWSAILIARNHSIRQFAGEPGINPMRATATAGTTLVDFDPLDPSTYDRVAPRTLVANYIFAALAGVIWCLQFLFYGMGQARIGTYGFTSGTAALISILVFAMIWGLVVREWTDTSTRTRLLATFGVALLIASVLLV